MSRKNKVNKTNYDQGGRLTPDDMARERKHQGEITGRRPGRDRIRGKAKAGGSAASRPRSAPEE